MSKSVLLAFSGGIDSTYAVDKLRSEGYDVTAIILNMTGNKAVIEQAMAKAEELGIELIIGDIQQLFKQEVIQYFTSEYMAGRTPAPCTVCNVRIKWKIIYEQAKLQGFDHIATGHYFNITNINGQYYITQAADKSKDQSYYLWMLPQEILSMAITPMGDVIKSDIKKHSNDRESMGVCFLEGKDYREFIKEECGCRIVEGEIVDAHNNVIGSHSGFPLYTIGQKRGLNLSTKTKQCVTDIDPVNNRLIIGYDEDLYKNELIISDCVIPDLNELLSSNDISVKIRGFGLNPEGFCSVTQCAEGLHISLDSPVWAPAKGQPIVLYRGERVVGGGFLNDFY